MRNQELRHPASQIHAGSHGFRVPGTSCNLLPLFLFQAAYPRLQALMNAVQLAGFFSAHAVWSISDGSTLIPMYVSADEGSDPEMKRLVHERLEEGVAIGQGFMESEEARNRVLIFDGRIPVGSEKLDALIVEWRNAGPPRQRVTIGVPYTPGSDRQAFLVHRPKILDIDSQSSADWEVLMDMFWQGVDRHEEGAKVWNEHFDESK